MAEQNIESFEVKLEDFFSKVLANIGKVTDQQIADLLKSRQSTIAVAESVTSGLLAARLTSCPGSSQFFIGGLVCYHSRLKVVQLGVPAATINRFGVVSSEVARAMAEGIKKRFGTDIALATTGVAGPTPLPPAPVGRVYIALARDNATEVKELNLQGTRSEIREKATQAALGVLWLYLGGDEVMK